MTSRSQCQIPIVMRLKNYHKDRERGRRLSSWPVINDPLTAKDAGRSSSVNRKERVSLCLDLHGQLNPERERRTSMWYSLPPQASREVNA